MESVSAIPMEKLVPHDRPMALLDHMLEIDGGRSVSQVAIHPESMFYQDGGVPAYVGLEYMAQAVAAHGGYRSFISGEPVKVGFLLGTPHLKFHCQSFPNGAILNVEVSEDWGDDQLMRFQCAIRNQEGALLMETGLNVFQPQNLTAYLEKNRSEGSAS